MAQRLRLRGIAQNLPRRTLGRVTLTCMDEAERPDCFFVVTKNEESIGDLDLAGYGAVLLENNPNCTARDFDGLPLVRYDDDLSFIKKDSILAINPDGHTFILFRPESTNNTIFSTVECNSNCLMCSQPPALSKDESVVQEHLRLVDLIKTPPESIGITGGEPTLLKDGLVSIISRLRDRFPDTLVMNVRGVM